MNHQERYYPNPYPFYDKENLLNDSTLTIQLYKYFLKHIRSLFQRLEENFKFNPKDTSVYTGATGIAILYMKLFEQNIFENEDFLQRANSIVKKSLEHIRKDRFSFLCGQTGVLATKVLINYLLGKDYKNYLKQICDLTPKILSDNDLPDEILFGRSGYLYSLLLIRSKIEDSKHLLSDNIIQSVVDKILKSGQSNSQKENSKIPLVYYWHEKGYVGAAHGYAGILYMLLEAYEYINENEINSLIKPTIDFVYQLRFPRNGNYRSSLTNVDDKLVHWCHGSPGVIHMLALAYERFNEQKYLDAAMQACDDIWERGLLKKGCGLCHGVAGNAYAFIRLFQLTNYQKYLYRAIKFAEWCCDYDLHNTRIADRPYSLFEGLSGTIYFLVDILKPKESRFPSFQIN